MPSQIHEITVELLRANPGLGAELWRQATGGSIPGAGSLEDTKESFADLKPPEYRADLVVRQVGTDRRTRSVLIIDVQLDRDNRKRYSWPLYVAGLRARHRCPTSLLVVALDAGVARWCAEPIHIGAEMQPFRAVVVSPGQIPQITDTEEAKEALPLAILSAAAHGHSPAGARIGTAAISACMTGLDEEDRSLYIDFIMSRLSPAAQNEVKTTMKVKLATKKFENYQWQSKPVLEWIDEGRKEGQKLGKVEGCRTSLLVLLEARNLKLTPEQQQRIQRCRSTAKLETWLRRAATARSVERIFVDD